MTNRKPLVSVVLLSHNHEQSVEQSVSSLLCQTYSNIEIIIIDDGSSDSTPEIIESLVRSYRGSNKIHFFRQEYQGVAKSLNRGIKKASGAFIAFLGSGDAYLPARIKDTLEKLISEPETTAAVYSDGYVINDKGYRTAKFSSKYIRPIGRNTFKELFISNWIPSIGVTYRMSSLIDVGLLDENNNYEVHNLLLRLSERFNIKYINKRLFLCSDYDDYFSKNSLELNEGIWDIKDSYAKISSFRKFIMSIRNREIFIFLNGFSALNVDLMFRLLLRKVQLRSQVQGVNGYELSSFLIAKAFEKLNDRSRFTLNRLRGLDIGSGSRIKGKIHIVGNKSNVKIGSNVLILGDIRIITERSKIFGQITISDNCVIDEGAVFFSLGGDIKLGKKCFVGTNTTIQANGDVLIGDFTMIAANTSIFANNHITDSIEIPFWGQGNRFEGIEIKRNCWIGTNVVILDGSMLGENCIVGASCLVKGEHEKNSRILAKPVVGKSS
jgi:glycosyltransferase involved in cell wall biosynthesis